MATSPRAQELVEQLLGLEASHASFPAESRRFGMGMEGMKAFVRKNKTAVTIGVVAVVAVVAFAGYQAYEKKHKSA
jgi:uncharacterized membrane protein YebE (DUF533 family)